MIALPCRTEEEEQEDKSVLVEVYSLSAGASFPTGVSFKYWLKSAASLNGVVANDFANDGHPLFLSFDLHDEAFRVIFLPNDEFRANLEIDTLEIRGSLSLDRLSTFVSAETSVNPGIIFSLNVPFQAGCGSE
uniref:Uncharacterized protein n=1 Tax=Quercus lobata TaxID=97700 RepID=A0A7N2LET6_QUELO